MPTVTRPLVLLDLDGTLIDSSPGIFASANAAFDALGIPRVREGELRSFIGPPLPASMRRHGIPEERIYEAVTAYREAFAAGNMWDCSVYAGIPGQLRHLREAGWTLAVATSKPEVFARPICERVGLDELLDGVYGAPPDHVPSTKAGVIGHALEELRSRGLLPERDRIVMVGDRHHDVDGAREHGIDCLGVGWGFAEPGELDGAAGFVVVVDDLASAVVTRAEGT